jgi:hypothetical protein
MKYLENKKNDPVKDLRDFISVDGWIESVRTDWEKKELKISLSATRRDTEYEAERLGELARLANTVRVLIYQLDESIDNAVAVNAVVDGVRLDWKIEKLVVTMTVDKLADELINKALRLGGMAHTESDVTVRFEAAQRRLL